MERVLMTESPQRVRLYDYPASGNCYKARLLLALLKQPYERVPVDIFAGDTLTPEFGRLNPARETPILELDDGEVIVQSNALLWYLTGEGSEYLPAGSLDQARVVQWLHFEQEWIVRGVGAARFLMLTGRNPSWSDRGENTARTRRERPRFPRGEADWAKLPRWRFAIHRRHLAVRVHTRRVGRRNQSHAQDG